MPVDDLNSMMQLKNQLCHQINQLKSVLGQNPHMGGMMGQNNMSGNMPDSGAMIRPNIMIPNYNSVQPNCWNAQVRVCLILRFYKESTRFYIDGTNLIK